MTTKSNYSDISDTETSLEANEGAYGKVKIIDDNTVVKICDKLNNDKTNYCKQNLQECVFLTLFKNAYIIGLNKIEITKDNLNIYLDRGDSTLYEYIVNTPRVERLKNLDNILYQLVYVLCVIHKNEFIHGDIKPNNIIYNSKTKQIKLIDFGGICSFRLKNYHRPICTPSFCPPEGWKQLEINCINDKFDVWSLGMTLYFYLTRRYLLDFKDDKTLDYVNEFKHSIETFYHHNIDDIRHLISPRMFNLMKKMLMYNPKDRISTSELYNDKIFKDFKKENITKLNLEFEYDYFNLYKFGSNHWKFRTELIEILYKFSYDLNILEYITLAVYIIDKYTAISNEKLFSRNYKYILSASLIIVSNLISSKNIKFNDLKSIFNINLNKLPQKNKIIIIKNIDSILSKLNFNVYTHTFDYMLTKNNIQPDYLCIKNILNEKRYIGLTQIDLFYIYLGFNKLYDIKPNV